MTGAVTAIEVVNATGHGAATVEIGVAIPTEAIGAVTAAVILTGVDLALVPAGSTKRESVAVINFLQPDYALTV